MWQFKGYDWRELGYCWFKLQLNKIYNEDCMKLLTKIEDESID